MNFSLEIGPHTDLETLPPVKDVYVTMLPGGDYKETAKKSGDLVKKGFNPVPHFPSRSIADEIQLKDYISRCKNLGVKQALVIGGSRDPIGKFDSSIQLLETGFFEKINFPPMRAFEFITGHVIYNPAYTYKFQLKTTIMCYKKTS